MTFENDEEIEILDLDEPVINNVDFKDSVINNNINSNINVDSNNKLNKNTKSNNNKLKKIIQIIFCSISFIFIIGCFVFYGSRFFKYYRIYNPKPISGGTKVTLLANEITSKSEIVYENDGLYISGGNYIYKGNVSNNYLKYNNMLWRILKINKDDTIDIILDDYINVLPWNSNNTDYVKSDIYNYLNDNFLKKINRELLVKTSFCTDKFNKLSDMSCNNKFEDSYVSLLDVNNFLNSIINGKTYLVTSDEIFWLSNQSKEKVWHTNGANVSMSESKNFYEVRPVLKLKSALILYDGDGSKESPYIIEQDNSIRVGSYVKLDDDLWVVNEKNNNIHLMLSKNLDKQFHFSPKGTKYDVNEKNSLAEYLNTTYLDSLSYKDILIEENWYSGIMNDSLNDIYEEEINVKVAIPNMLDIKLDSKINNYLLMTFNNENLIYTYGNIVKAGKTTIYRNIRPCISISSKNKIKSGSGTVNDPFVLEV